MNELLKRITDDKTIDYVNDHNLPLTIYGMGEQLHIGIRAEYNEIELLSCFELTDDGLEKCLKAINHFRKCSRCSDVYCNTEFEHCFSCHLQTSINNLNKSKICGICDNAEKHYELTKCCSQELCQYCADKLLQSNCPYCSSEIW